MASLDEIITRIFDIENYSSQFKALIIFLITIGWLCFIILNSNRYEQNKSQYQDMLKDEFSGKIVERYIDKNNRNSPTFILNNSNGFVQYSQLWKKINIGDSLFKKSNSRLVTIIKKDTIIVFDIYKEYKYVDSIIRTGN